MTFSDLFINFIYVTYYTIAIGAFQVFFSWHSKFYKVKLTLFLIIFHSKNFADFF